MEKNERLDWEEAVEIADILTQTDNPEGDYAISENALLNKWSIDMSTFHEIINGVFKMIDFGISPITQTPFVGISKDKREWIAKKEVSQRSTCMLWKNEGIKCIHFDSGNFGATSGFAN